MGFVGVVELGFCFQIKKGEHSDDVWKLTGRILAVNPDLYPLWSHRRVMLLKEWDEADGEGRCTLANRELLLTQEALSKRNPKSYCSWHHRMWMVNVVVEEEKSGVASWSEAPTSVEKELLLCESFLERDERNFHCWNYWRWLCVRSGRGVSEFREFSEKMLRRNFSNYSAWHERARALGPLGRCNAEGLGEELKFLRSAFFTEPDDQAPWMYARWVFRQLGRLARGEAVEPLTVLETEEDIRAAKDAKESLSTASDWVGVRSVTDTVHVPDAEEQTRALQALSEELVPIATLASEEKASRWPLLGLAALRHELASLPHSPPTTESLPLLSKTLPELWEMLEKADPTHAAYYRHMKSLSE